MQFRVRRTIVRHARLRNMSPKFRTIKLPHKDKINSKISPAFDAVSDSVDMISILRCVICLVRRSRRMKSSAIEKQNKINCSFRSH
jgi:hypothetical protein